jgi:hypothetical protein
MERMKNVFWFVLGLAGGFVLAHLVDKDPRGHELLADVDARISEFTDRIGDAYRAQEAQIAGLVENAKAAAAGVVDTAMDVAQDIAASAEDGAAKLTD